MKRYLIGLFTGLVLPLALPATAQDATVINARIMIANGVVFESGAIVQYVLSKYADGRLQPAPSSADFGPYLQWLHYAEGMIMPPVNTIVVETILLAPEKRNQGNVDRAVKLLGRMLEAVETQLEGREFLAGAFSGADIMTGHATIVAAKLGADITDKPNVSAYIQRLNARPALAAAWQAGT